MICWVAVTFGALDLRQVQESFDSNLVFAILPVESQTIFVEPIGLKDAPAILWESLVNGPVRDDDLSEENRRLVREFEESGIASRNTSHAFRLNHVDTPWLSSPLHELVYALIACVARTLDMDLAFLKGPVLQIQGIRNRHHSGDVDVLVSESDIELLCNELKKWNWKLSPDVWLGTRANHSVTMGSHPWACEIDVHRYMPGCHASNEEAFQLIRRDSIHVSFASVQCSVPSVEANTVLNALHETRPQFDRIVRDETILGCASTFQRNPNKVFEMARELGALEALRPVVELAYPGQDINYKRRAPLNWQWRKQSNRLFAYLMALNMLPVHERSKIFFRMIWPSKAVVTKTNSNDIFSKSTTLIPGRINRFIRAIRSNKRQ